ncbi:MAG: Bax inhibitor-1 family protein [Candidatus Accumulibacter sp.]|jgi:modulator of FtsH protease|nr:Bax inhibitor-1 family protein [Accumulibacter sp.]
MQQPYQVATQSALTQQNKVLRNTYFLLAISMLPTIAGAVLGLVLGPRFLLLLVYHPIISTVAFFGIIWGLMFGIQRTKDSAAGIVLLLLFTLFMGLMLTPILTFALRLSNGVQLIAAAAGGTAAIFFVLAGIATFSKKDFSFLGKFLTVGLIVVLLAIVANIFLNMPALDMTISVACIALFSLFILYDVSRVLNGGETNYITATLAIYLDVYNLFVYLLRLLIALSGRE